MKYKKKKITIEDLAVMIKHGFDETAKKDDVNARFDEVDARFEKIETRLETTATKTDIARLEKEIAELRHDLGFVQSMPVRLERRMDTLEDGLRLVKTKLGMR